MSSLDIQEFISKLANLKEKNDQLLQQNSLLKEGKKLEFLTAFEDYFREMGFVIRKRPDSVMASYDTLNFKAFSGESGELMIMKGREQIACIGIHYNGEKEPQVLFNQINNPDVTVSQLKKEIEKEETLLMNLKNPVFYYGAANSDVCFDSPHSVLEDIFQD